MLKSEEYKVYSGWAEKKTLLQISVVIDTTIADLSFCRWNFKTHAHATL